MWQLSDLLKLGVSTLALSTAKACDEWTQVGGMPEFQVKAGEPFYPLGQSTFVSNNTGSRVRRVVISYNAYGDTPYFENSTCPEPLKTLAFNNTYQVCWGVDINAEDFTTLARKIELTVKDLPFGQTAYGYGSYYPEGWNCVERPLNNNSLVFAVDRAFDNESHNLMP